MGGAAARESDNSQPVSKGQGVMLFLRGQLSFGIAFPLNPPSQQGIVTLVLKGAWQAKSNGKGKRSAEDLMQYGRRQLHTENLQGGVQGTRARESCQKYEEKTFIQSLLP